MRRVVLACAAIGLIAIAATFASRRQPGVDTEAYGRRLIAATAEILGPAAPDPRMRYTDSRLACSSCHLDGGGEPGNLSLATAIARYPRHSPRSNAAETIEDRINGCMTRSMNGRPLANGSPEMRAMVAYLGRLARQEAATAASLRQPQDPPPFRTPNRAADLASGERVFAARCAACHGEDGAGLPAVFPPLWGPGSFNDGAGLHRVLTAARFIKAKMPLGKADLSDGDAFDVAAYVNSKPRPAMANLDRDYPDLTTKPVDTGYGPYADPFPVEQHRFGPFQPIEAWYRK
jgi:thiosulfate dehydrogenase